jgi:hypothetical protein
MRDIAERLDTLPSVRLPLREASMAQGLLAADHGIFRVELVP